jgi:hypothetical protein
MEDKGEEWKKFELVCRKCKGKVNSSSANIFINWDKQYYVVTCLNHDCGQEEVFDAYGKRINLDDVKIDTVTKDKKLVN